MFSGAPLTLVEGSRILLPSLLQITPRPSSPMELELYKSRTRKGKLVQLNKVSATLTKVLLPCSLKVDYRAFDVNNITPRFEFGFGLS
jgi:hypothetical protein